MKSSNNPTDKLLRRKRALSRYPVAPQMPGVVHIKGDNTEERVKEIRADHEKRVQRWTAERERLIELCSVDETFTRGERSKKDHSSRAKIGRNQ